MLVITSPYDLKRYLETRLKMVERNSNCDFAQGACCGFRESIRAVEALIIQIEEKEKSAKDQDTPSV